ncbi:DUF6597 domain-containing transcriptional factor [Streptomyces sp. NPDC059165]|uniref:DUF6597 domain-containing transcriptional factor n=1 Tax=Streptomyces sp. NPDC059165 TaxID=3346751 RepID=UPI0036C45D8D
MYAERASLVAGAVVWTNGPFGPVLPVLPDGCMDLMWTAGRLLVAGPDTHVHLPGGVGTASYAGVRFAPGAAPALLGVPAHELRDRRVDLADLWPGKQVRGLAERVGDAADPAAGLEAVALALAARRPPADPVLEAVVRALDAGRSVAETADAVGFGARRLHRRSLDAFGYGPKTLARILRLQRALALVRAGVPQAGAALAAGCADQAHLAREMRELTGLTVGRYAALAKSETPQPSGSRTTA